MALITRVSRLFRADFHAVLDRLEEPEVLLKQAVREMEDDIAHDEQQVKVLTYELRQLAGRRGDLGDSLRRIGEELDVCFASDKEDLARALIKRKLEVERLRKVLAQKHDSAEDAVAELNKRLQENRGRLAAMRQKVELFTEEDTHDNDETWMTPDISVRDEEVEVAFLREKQNRGRS